MSIDQYRSLSARAKKDLEASGLTEADARKAGHFSATSGEYLGSRLKDEGIIFNYCDPFGKPYDRLKDPKDTSKPGRFHRVKVLWDKTTDEDGESRPKYLSPSDNGCRPYFSQLYEWKKHCGKDGLLHFSESNPCIITEGEKKGDKGCKEGFPVIALGGVDSWTDRRCYKPDPEDSKIDDRDIPLMLLPELRESICWHGSHFFICFDSDIAQKASVKQSLFRLAIVLTKLGAIVKCIILPTETTKDKNGQWVKNGLDDFLVRYGADALRELMAWAPVPVKHDKKAGLVGNASAIENPPVRYKAAMVKVSWQDKFAYCDGVGWFLHSQNHWQKTKIESWLPRFMDAQNWADRSPATKGVIFDELRSVDGLWVDSKLWEPKGINCTNGVVRWSREKQKIEFVEYSPRHYFRQPPIAKYDPDADTTECNRMLAAVDEKFWDLLLKTWAAPIDMEAVRVKVSRLRSLILQGEGSNGKDTHRTAVSRMYGNYGVTGISLSAFAAYEAGKQFGLARLSYSRINWSSENKRAQNISDLDSLKRVATGDPISIEFKNQDDFEVIPTCALIFATNDIPNFDAGDTAIATRLAIIPYSKTFTDNPDPKKRQLKADPRLKEDPEFLDREILPALLNKMIAAFESLMKDGINYDVCADIADEVRRVNSHLYEFSQDIGLIEDEEALTPLSEVWSRLLQYYESNEICKRSSDGSLIWSPDTRKGDPWIKSTQQLSQRITSVFPKARKEREKIRNTAAIRGIRFATPEELAEQSTSAEAEVVPESTEVTAAPGPAQTVMGIPTTEDRPEVSHSFKVGDRVWVRNWEPNGNGKPRRQDRGRVSQIGLTNSDVGCGIRSIGVMFDDGRYQVVAPIELIPEQVDEIAQVGVGR